jgi:hypothetical protein
MSKLADVPAGTTAQDLKAFVAMGDTSVPGVEMSDLNDGDILALTREQVNPNGQFQFVYVGREGEEPITSDWISQEHKKKVLRSWVDGVKDAIIGRSQEKIRAANEARLEERAKRIREEQFSDGPVEVDTPTPVVRKEAPRVVAPNADPVSYVEEQLAISRERLAAALRSQQDIIREVLNARRDFDKWKALAAALGSDDSGPNHRIGIQLSTEASTSVVHRKPA